LDRTKHESITEVVTTALADWIEDNSKSIRQTLIDFPEPNFRLEMPSISVIAPRMEFEPRNNPYLQNPVNPDEIKDSQAQVNWIIGDYEMSLQLDLWCGNKEELDDVFSELFEILNPGIKPGVNIKMPQYFNAICSFLYVSHDRNNEERESTQDEWRITLNVLATCKAIRSRKQFIIEETIIEPESEISTDVLIDINQGE